MTYLALARRYRPKTFAEVVGQPTIVQALERALARQRLHHALLLTGTRGVGKTTLARLLAKSLNCETGITPTPCNQCQNCQAIDAGRFLDVLEIDAASRTKVEETQEILANVLFKPASGRMKVYIIDEVHMLSTHSFNALLKTLEEPPPYVTFILATTDPQKIPITVLSRCLQLRLRPLPEEVLVAQLEKVLKEENIPAEKEALVLLARAAEGSMRDALSLTEQALALADEAGITAALCQDFLGVLPERATLSILEAVLAEDFVRAQEAVTLLKKQGAEARAIVHGLLRVIHEEALQSVLPRGSARFPDVSPEQWQLYFEILTAGQRYWDFAPDPFLMLNMLILRLVYFMPEKPETQPFLVPPAEHPPVAPASETTSCASSPTKPSWDHITRLLDEPDEKKK